MGTFDWTTTVRTDETLGIPEDQWIILRLIFEGMNNKDTARHLAMNKNYVETILYMHRMLGKKKLYEAIDMLKAEKAAANQPKEQP